MKTEKQRILGCDKVGNGYIEPNEVAKVKEKVFLSVGSFSST